MATRSQVRAVTTLWTGTKPLTGTQQRIRQTLLGSNSVYSCTCNRSNRCNRKTLQTNLWYSTQKSTIVNHTFEQPTVQSNLAHLVSQNTHCTFLKFKVELDA